MIWILNVLNIGPFLIVSELLFQMLQPLTEGFFNIQLVMVVQVHRKYYLQYKQIRNIENDKTQKSPECDSGFIKWVFV